jgi:hypothetical protein
MDLLNVKRQNLPSFSDKLLQKRRINSNLFTQTSPRDQEGGKTLKSLTDKGKEKPLIYSKNSAVWYTTT